MTHTQLLSLDMGGGEDESSSGNLWMWPQLDTIWSYKKTKNKTGNLKSFRELSVIKHDPHQEIKNEQI